MHIEADLDSVHTQRLIDLIAWMNRPVPEILAAAIDHLYQRESLEAEDQDAIVRRLKLRFAHLPVGVSLADELIAERREEVAREDRP